MIYFYAGLGAAMMTGIMLLFEIGLALTGQATLPERDTDRVADNWAAQADRTFLKLLSNQSDLSAIGAGRSGNLLCQQLLCRIKGVQCVQGNSRNAQYQSLDDYAESKLTSSVKPWMQACVLERQLQSSRLVHRILIQPNSQRPMFGYELFSCLVNSNSVDVRCPFEKEV